LLVNQPSEDRGAAPLAIGPRIAKLVTRR
jgi:hypothetical protein